MPWESPNRILRGARFATTTVSRPTRVFGRRHVGCRRIPGAEIAEVEHEPEQSVGAVDEFGGDDAGNPQFDAGEVSMSISSAPAVGGASRRGFVGRCGRRRRGVISSRGFLDHLRDRAHFDPGQERRERVDGVAVHEVRRVGPGGRPRARNRSASAMAGKIGLR